MTVVEQYRPGVDQWHYYKPRGTQAELWSRNEGEVLLSGPAGTGKSRACLEKIHDVCRTFPGVRALILRKELTALTSTGMVTFREKVVPEAISAGMVKEHGGGTMTPAAFRYNHNGSVVVVGGMDKASKIMSSEYDMIYIQEATELEEDDWESLTTRLRNNKAPIQQLLADCNPSTPTHWLKQRCDKGKTVMLNTQHEENPLLYDDYGELTSVGINYMSKLDALTGVRFQRLRKGLWAAAEGVIFEHWDPAVHLIEPFMVPMEWRRWWSVDFGHTHPFVWQNWAEDDDGRLFLTQEIYRSQRLVEHHAQDILYAVGDPVNRQPKPQAIICDHDAEGRATLEWHLHMPTRAAFKTVMEGIEAVQVRMLNRRLFIFKGATIYRDQVLADRHQPTSTADEIPGYIWMDHTKPKEGPVKECDDGCDAMRYMVAARDLAGAPTVRWMGR